MNIFILFNLNILNLNSFKSHFSWSKRCFRRCVSMTVCDLPSLQQCDAICGANDLISQISWSLHVLLLMVEACQLESCLLRLIVNAWRVLVFSGAQRPTAGGWEIRHPRLVERTSHLQGLRSGQPLFHHSFSFKRSFIYSLPQEGDESQWVRIFQMGLRENDGLV